MREEYRQRLISEYRYAVTKMQEASLPARKLFYFSVFFGEAQRILNWEWDTDLALIYTITRYVHVQLNGSWGEFIKQPELLPIDWNVVIDKLTQAASDLTTYLDKSSNQDNKEVLCTMLGQFAEIAYSVSGNGSYLYDKGFLKL